MYVYIYTYIYINIFCFVDVCKSNRVLYSWSEYKFFEEKTLVYS